MKVTRQQMILCGVIALGALVVGVDQLFIGRASATAQTPAQQYAVARPAAIAPSRNAAAGQAAVSLTQRLQLASGKFDHVPLRDAFAMGEAWRPKEQPAPPTPQVNLAEKFQQAHQLSGVLKSGGRGVAMVDGSIIGVGQKLDGFTLVSISHRSAMFKSGSQTAVLNLAEVAAGNEP